MNPVEVNNETAEAVDEAALMRLAQHVLAALGVNPLAELSIVLVDEEAMAALHVQWMDLPGPTDVMAFPMDGEDGTLAYGRDDPSSPGGPDGADPGPALLGDVVLCPAVARRQAEAAGHGEQAELFLLTTHGILHLLGYDHGEPDEEREMFELQAKILAGWSEQNGGEPIRAPRPGTAGAVRDVAGGSGGSDAAGPPAEPSPDGGR